MYDSVRYLYNLQILLQKKSLFADEVNYNTSGVSLMTE